MTMMMIPTIWNKLKEVRAVMINFFAMQIEEGWITLEQVPRRYRERVRRLLELSHAGAEETEQEEV